MMIRYVYEDSKRLKKQLLESGHPYGFWHKLCYQMNLGILVKDGKVVNHRSFVKVIFNPIFRCLGFQLASMFDDQLSPDSFCGKIWIKAGTVCSKGKRWGMDNHNPYDRIIREKMFI